MFMRLFPEGAAFMMNEKKLVFVIDDEEMLRSLTCDIIMGEGYEVISASNGREALEIFRDKGPEVGLVIMDMSMPEMDGTQTFQALRKLEPDLKVLVSSGFTEDPLVKRLLNEGAYGVIPKPFKVDDLTAKLAEILGKKQ